MTRPVYSALLFEGAVHGFDDILIPTPRADTDVIRLIVAWNQNPGFPTLEGVYAPPMFFGLDGLLPFWFPGDGFPLYNTPYRWEGPLVVPGSSELYATAGDDNWSCYVSGYRLFDT